VDADRDAIAAALRDLVRAHLEALGRFPRDGPERARALVDGLERGLADAALAVGASDAPPLADGEAIAGALRRGIDRDAWARALVAESVADASGAAFATRQALASPAWRTASAAEAAVEATRALVRLEDAATRALDAVARWAGESPARVRATTPLVANALAMGAHEAARDLVRAALADAGARDGPVARALDLARDPVALARCALHADLLRARLR